MKINIRKNNIELVPYEMDYINEAIDHLEDVNNKLYAAWI